MTRSYVTFLILMLAAVVLSVVCGSNWDLITGDYDDQSYRFVEEMRQSDSGKYIINHYSGQLGTLHKRKMGPYADLNPKDGREVQSYLATMIFAGFTALFVSVVSIALILFNMKSSPEQEGSWKKVVAIVLLVVFIGTTIRLVLASSCYGNYDMQSFEKVAELVQNDKNVYAKTGRYNYSPVWFTVLGVLKQCQLGFEEMPFHFVVKSFGTLVDLITLLFLLLISRFEKLSLARTALFFYLNPISFLLTGYHGQFENLAILMVVIGLFCYLKYKDKPVLAVGLLWAFSTFGLIVKHSIFYEVLITAHATIKRWWVKMALSAAGAGVFLLTFLPYWSEGHKGIVKNVFLYSSGEGYYGVMNLFAMPVLKYVFIAGMILLPLFIKSKDVIGQCLLGLLFFLAFTTGVAGQYIVMPIALGALRPGKGFYVFTAICSFFVLGYFVNVYVPICHQVKWNAVWVSAVFWFVVQFRSNRALQD